MRVMGRRQAAQGGFFARRSVDALLSDSDFIFNNRIILFLLV